MAARESSPSVPSMDEDRLGMAKAGQGPLVEQRGVAEQCFTDYNQGHNHTLFEKIVDAAASGREIPRLSGPLKNAQFIIKNFKTYHEPVQGDQPVCLVPSLTFGDIMVPVKLNTKYNPLCSHSMSRKYVLLADNTSSEKTWQLLTTEWKCPIPNVVISCPTGDISNLTEDKSQLEAFITSFYKFCKSTGTWILTDGLHCGVARFLGRIFEYDLEPVEETHNPDLQRDVTLVGICDWENIEDPTLLHGISLEDTYPSYYFYPRESNLKDGDEGKMLSPHHHVFLLVQRQEGKEQKDLRKSFECFLKSGKLGSHHLPVQEEIAKPQNARITEDGSDIMTERSENIPMDNIPMEL